MKLADFVIKDAIIPELKATDRDGVIREMIAALVAAKAVAAADAPAITKAIIDRENLGSTGVVRGVAVPHGRHAAIKKRACAIGRSTVGIDFKSLDQSPVYSIFMLLSPPTSPDGHLQAMEKIFLSLNQDTFRKFLRQLDTKDKIFDLIEEADQPGAFR